MKNSRLAPALVACAFVSAGAAYAHDASKVVGTWKLVSYEVEQQAIG